MKNYVKGKFGFGLQFCDKVVKYNYLVEVGLVMY